MCQCTIYCYVCAERILSAYEVQYPYSTYKARLTLVQPKKGNLIIHYFGGWPLTVILSKDEDKSTEYIGVQPPCIYLHFRPNKLILQEWWIFFVCVMTLKSWNIRLTWIIVCRRHLPSPMPL